jgi:hypothetical protein
MKAKAAQIERISTLMAVDMVWFPSGWVERRSDRELSSHSFVQFTLEALTECKISDTIQQFQMAGKRPGFLRKMTAIA